MHRDFSRIRHYSSCSDDSDADYGYTHNQEFMRHVQQTEGNMCVRCDKRVYATEKVEVGILLHKGCFRCVECGVTLSMNSFVLAKRGPRGFKDVFCKAHAPKLVSHNNDTESMDIRNAVHAQRMTKKQSFNKQIRLPAGQEGWACDPHALEFEHAKDVAERNKFRRPKEYDNQADDCEYERGEVIRRLRQGHLRDENVKESVKNLPKKSKSKANRKFPINSDYMEPNALWSPNAVEDPWHPKFIPQQNGYQQEPIYAHAHVLKGVGNNEPIYGNPMKLMAQGNMARLSQSNEGIYESLNVIRQAPQLPPRQSDRYNYNGGAYGDPYRHDAMAVQNGRGPRHGMYNNGNPQKEYFRDDAFIAQNQLELRQRHEHGEMWREFEKMREEEIIMLENDIKKQMQMAVNDVIIQMDTGSFEGDIQLEKMRIEEHFRRLRDEKMSHLMDKLDSHERLRLDDMIDRQTTEMMHLIDEKVPTKMPSPVPPRKKKAQLYSSPRVFDDIDFHAKQVAQQDQGSFTELVYELTRNCKNQLEKVRAIFKWIAIKDLNKMIFSEELTEENPYHLLKGIKYGIESYHDLFKRLCSYAGLPVKVVRGLSKSAGYRPGMPFHDGRFKNSWTAVNIDNNWRFTDCHWGARHINPTGSQEELDQLDNIQYALDEFFFLTDPDDMMYMHYPEDKDWQLMEKPISLEQFIQRPVVKSHFFHFGLKIPPTVTSVIETNSGIVEFSLRRGKDTPLAFNTRLEADDEVLDGYCIHHNDGNEVIFNLTLPRRGVFYFTLFACDIDKSESYSNVCSYRIKCTHVENKPFCKFPRLPDGYGPTRLADELGLSAEKFSEYYIVANEDKLILNLKFKQPVKISHKLMCGDLSMEEHFLNRLIFIRYRDSGFVSYLMRFPVRGIYVLSIFAGSKKRDTSTLDCACRYLIQCNVQPKSILRPYPKAQQFWMKTKLHEPTTGDLKLGKNVKFKLEAKDADAVAVIVGQKWTYLKKDPENEKIWYGVANTGKSLNNTLDVYMRGKDQERDFFPLLEYRLVPDD